MNKSGANMGTMTINTTSLTTEANVTIVPLEFFQCFITELPESGIDCSLRNPNICVKCEIQGGCLTGGSEHDIYLGNLICYIVLTFSILIGVIGIFANLLIILVLFKKRLRNHKLKAFDFLVLCLSYADFFCCLTSLSSCTAYMFSLAKTYGTKKSILYWIYVSMAVLQFCRSASFHITVLITLERYLGIAYPIHSRIWFSRTKSKILVLLILVYVSVLCIPRYTSSYIGKNVFGEQEGGFDVPSLAKFEYIFMPSELHVFWLETLGTFFDYFVHLLDILLPNLGLLIINICSVKKIHSINQKHSQLNSTQQNEIQIARMFTPVVIIVLLCSTWTMITFISTYYMKIFYRELWAILILTYQVNSSANFFIYYYRSKDFRTKTQYILPICKNI